MYIAPALYEAGFVSSAHSEQRHRGDGCRGARGVCAAALGTRARGRLKRARYFFRLRDSGIAPIAMPPMPTTLVTMSKVGML